MIKIVKTAFTIVKENFILTSAFITIFITMQLFSLVVLLKQANFPLIGLFSCIILNLLSLGLFTGWMNVAKKLIIKDKNTTFVTSFFSGIGEKFLTNLKLGVFYTLLFSFILFAFYMVVTHFYPAFNISKVDLMNVMQQIEVLSKSSNTLLDSKIAVIFLWITIFHIAFYIGLYLFSFLLADVYITNETSFIKNLCKVSKFLFKNFGIILANFLFLGLLNAIIFVFAMITTTIPLLNILAFILLGYYASFYIIMVFLLYDEKREKDICDNGCDCNRKD